MSEDPLVYRLYRCATDTQHGSKDWAIATAPDGHLAIRHGATGKTARLLDVPPASFKATSPEVEMTRREEEQRKDGYRYIGQAVVRKGHLETVAARAPMNRAAQDSSDIHWEIRQPVERAALLSQLQTAVTRLQSGPLRDPIEFDREQGTCRVHDGVEWELGYSDAGGLSSDGRGGGVIHLDQGAVPLLLMIHLQRAFPGQVQFADAKGQMLEPTFKGDDPLVGQGRFAPSEVMPLIGRLGLCPAWMSLTDTAKTDSTAAIWV